MQMRQYHGVYLRDRQILLQLCQPAVAQIQQNIAAVFSLQ